MLRDGRFDIANVWPLSDVMWLWGMGKKKGGIIGSQGVIRFIKGYLSYLICHDGVSGYSNKK